MKVAGRSVKQNASTPKGHESARINSIAQQLRSRGMNKFTGTVKESKRPGSEQEKMLADAANKLRSRAK